MHRRKFLTGLAAVGLAGTGLTARATTGRRLIDVHNHVIPPFYLAENRDRIDVSLSRALLDWTPQQSIDAMDQHGVETAVLSLSTLGVWFGNAETARSTACQIASNSDPFRLVTQNEYGGHRKVACDLAPHLDNCETGYL